LTGRTRLNVVHVFDAYDVTNGPRTVRGSSTSTAGTAWCNSRTRSRRPRHSCAPPRRARA